MNFWKTLKIPFTAQAPMEGVTDSVFRQIIVMCGKPDVFYTEFVSTSGLVSKGKAKVAEHLKFVKSESPIVVQLFGEVPDEFYASAKLVSKMGFSGIDINMGCPDKDVVKKGGGAALIKNQNLAREIILAVKAGANGLPVSVKTRSGYDKSDIDNWIRFLISQELNAITIHFRTFRELFNGEAHWDFIPQIKKLRDELSPDTVIIGNGDLKSMTDIDDKHLKYGIDGYMIGRGVLYNPWVFNRKVRKSDITTIVRLQMYLTHIDIFEKTWGADHNPADLKKYCQAYINTLYDATGFRNQMMQSTSLTEFRKQLDDKIKEIT
jgi:nifR3 family TIM-barrel protein